MVTDGCAYNPRPSGGSRRSQALAIFVVVLAFNLVGEGLRDALDPHER